MARQRKSWSDLVKQRDRLRKSVFKSGGWPTAEEIRKGNRIERAFSNVERNMEDAFFGRPANKVERHISGVGEFPEDFKFGARQRQGTGLYNKGLVKG